MVKNHNIDECDKDDWYNGYYFKVSFFLVFVCTTVY